jgi:DNA-binding CsgD family transcriptional regulator
MKPDIVGVLEAAYLIETIDDDAWLTELLNRVRPSIDRGLGVIAFFADFSRPQFASQPIEFDCPEGWQRAYEVMMSAKFLTPEVVERMQRNLPITTMSAEFGKALFGRMQSMLGCTALGVRDWLRIKVIDPTAHGMVLCAPWPRKTRAPRALVGVWNHIATHIATGYRLRRQRLPHWRVVSDWSSLAEAILDPRTKKVVHARGEAVSRDAHEALLTASMRMDRSRGRMRRVDPEEAVALWLGMVDCRWSLVEQEERDGRRYLLALRNDVHTPKLSPLSERERQVLAYAALGHPNKLIAYELGIAPSTVSVLLGRVQTKLGASSRNEMLALYRAASAGALPDDEGER